VFVAGVRAERVVAIDETLTAEPAVGLTSLPAKGGQAWRVDEEGWALRVLPRESAAPARALLSEHRGRLEGGRRWTHGDSWLLWQAGQSALAVTWPGSGAVELLSASIDDSHLSQPRVEQGTLPLPPADRPGARRVTVRWRYPESRGEALDRPDLT